MRVAVRVAEQAGFGDCTPKRMPFLKPTDSLNVQFGSAHPSIIAKSVAEAFPATRKARPPIALWRIHKMIGSTDAARRAA